MVFLCAGGMLDDDGKMIGSLLVMEFENREQLDEYLADRGNRNILIRHDKFNE